MNNKRLYIDKGTESVVLISIAPKPNLCNLTGKAGYIYLLFIGILLFEHK